MAGKGGWMSWLVLGQCSSKRWCGCAGPHRGAERCRARLVAIMVHPWRGARRHGLGEEDGIVTDAEALPVKELSNIGGRCHGRCEVAGLNPVEELVVVTMKLDIARHVEEEEGCEQCRQWRLAARRRRVVK